MAPCRGALSWCLVVVPCLGVLSRRPDLVSCPDVLCRRLIAASCRDAADRAVPDAGATPANSTPTSDTSLNQRQSADKAAAVNGHCVTPVMCILSLNYCVGGVGASLTHDRVARRVATIASRVVAGLRLPPHDRACRGQGVPMVGAWHPGVGLRQPAVPVPEAGKGRCRLQALRGLTQPGLFVTNFVSLGQAAALAVLRRRSPVV